VRGHRARIFPESTGLWGPSVDRCGTVKTVQISTNTYYRKGMIETARCEGKIIDSLCTYVAMCS